MIRFFIVIILLLIYLKYKDKTKYFYFTKLDNTNYGKINFLYNDKGYIKKGYCYLYKEDSDEILEILEDMYINKMDLKKGI